MAKLWWISLLYPLLYMLYLSCHCIPTLSCTVYCTCNFIHRDTALAILATKDGLTTLETDHKPAPLQLLIRDMPSKNVSFSGYLYALHNGNWVNDSLVDLCSGVMLIQCLFQSSKATQ